MDAWMISVGLLWFVVIAILFYLVALTRQIGVLHLRLRPTGARTTSSGLEIGIPSPLHVLSAVDGQPVYIGPDALRESIILFVSTTCPACQSLVASLRSYVEGMSAQIVLVFGAEDRSEVEAFLRQHKVPKLPVIIGPNVVSAFNVTAIPYGFLIGKDSIIREKGVANTAEHVESLWNAYELHMSPTGDGVDPLTIHINH